MCSAVISKMALSPALRLTELESRLSAVHIHTVGPCGGFTAAYRCACHYHGIQFVDEIAWVGLFVFLTHLRNTLLYLNHKCSV